MGRSGSLAGILHGRSSWRFPVLLLGALFAQGRRVVASQIRAAGVSHDFQDFYFFLQSVGRKWKELGIRLLILLIPILKYQQRVLLAIDDSPKRRLIFLDECATKTNMTPLRARAVRGQRVVELVPFGHWQTSTLIQVVDHRQVVASLVVGMSRHISSCCGPMV